MSQTPYEKALSKAKIALMSRPDSTFFLTVCFSLPIIWDEKIPTACTNGKYIKINQVYFMSLDPDEQLFLLLHETLHVAYLHMIRLMGRDIRRWNYAADYVINLQLVERGFKMPKGLLYDTKWANMSTEEVYNQLPPNIELEIPIDIEQCDEPDEKVTQDIQDILVRGQVASRMANDKPGSIPGDIQIFLDKLLNPVLPWNRILQKHLSSYSKNDYSFRKPNRRFFPKYHLPSLHSERLVDLAIAVDTSGSVSDKDFQVFVNEVSGILRMLNPEKLTLVQFDTTIKSVDTIRSVQELENCKFTGRGGTLISPVMKWAEENKPQLLLVFSDGGFRVPTQKPPGDLMWIIHNNPQWTCPVGKTIHYVIN